MGSEMCIRDRACNGEIDCLDKSDEIGCDQIEFHESYDKSVPSSIGGKNFIWKNIGNFYNNIPIFQRS